MVRVHEKLLEYIVEMNKVFVLPPSEDWIVDRFVKEWNEDNSDISVSHPKNADVMWLLS